jgi:hypothetical protein
MTSARCATHWPTISLRPQNAALLFIGYGPRCWPVRSMDRALLVKNVVVSTVKTIRTLRGPGGALGRQRRRRPPARSARAAWMRDRCSRR